MNNQFSNSFVNVGEVRAQCDTCVDTPVAVFASSNAVALDLLNVALEKSVSRTCVVPGTAVNYTLRVINNSTVPIVDSLLIDEAISSYLKVCDIKLNGRPVSNCENLNSGIFIPEIAPGGCAAVTFDAYATPCARGVISNTARLVYKFLDNGQVNTAEVLSNPVQVEVVEPAIELEKQADRQIISGDQDIITFTLKVTNRGSVPLDDVVITDKLSGQLRYVPNSTVINGCGHMNENPNHGINVGCLAVGESKTVTFKATANISNPCPCAGANYGALTTPVLSNQVESCSCSKPNTSTLSSISNQCSRPNTSTLSTVSNQCPKQSNLLNTPLSAYTNTLSNRAHTCPCRCSRCR